MSVMIRLKRMGTKKKPFYRIVAINKSQKRDGKPLEELGYYDPKKEEDNVALDRARVEYWVQNGAKLSQTVNSIVKKLGG